MAISKEIETKEEIIKLLTKRKENNEITTTKDIVEILNISYPTATKYLMVMEAEKTIRVVDCGNNKVYFIGDNNAKE